ncbi:MAG: hypothetical protein AAF846_30160 [Chloroflexota bacterium]
MASYTKKSASEWTWQKGSRHHSVRYFESTNKLIWSGWADTSNGPVFEEGFTQSVENFLQDGVPHLNPPADLLADLETALQENTTKQSSGLFAWFKRGK